ncbi:DNA repair protein RecO [Lacticaseibacillus zhaodongensis]|uniref:DNA repair protein RecO n=1 Tax=Lacticaseibacillus zhaodongensis TaxID=2668065 RepID=UPI0012D34C7F|nr:DNA repair protein RecO [Lacticaseibacillus zhaodongensis]
MASAPQDFKGIVLSRYNYKESDLLVKILTREFGKRMFLFRRARKPGFKMAVGVMPFTASNYVGVIRSSGLSYVNTLRGSEEFSNISADIERNAYATYVLALIDLAFSDNVAVPQWYDFAETALRRIDSGADPQIISNIAEVQLLTAFGVGPHWQNCVVCGRSDLPLDFSDSYGGLLCQNHWGLDEHRYHASQKAIYLLRQFSVVKLEQLGNIKVSPTTKHELRSCLDRIYDDLVGVTPRAKRFLDELNGGSNLRPLRPRKPRTDADR